MYTNADITIYNKYKDDVSRTNKYKRRVLKGVFFDPTQGVNTNNTGLENSNKVTIVIPFRVECDKEYIDPINFQRVVYLDDYFTIQKGDRIVLGDVPFIIQDNPADLDRYYEAYTITSVDTKDFGSPHMRHWEVEAK